MLGDQLDVHPPGEQRSDVGIVGLGSDLRGDPVEGDLAQVPDPACRTATGAAPALRRCVVARNTRGSGPVRQPGGGDDPGLGIALLDGQRVDPVHVHGLVPEVPQAPRRPVAAVLGVRARALATFCAQRQLDEGHGVAEIVGPRHRVAGEADGHHPDRGVRRGDQADLARPEAPRDPLDPGRRMDSGEHV